MAEAVERSWSWSFAAPPEILWPALADTARINEATGFPRYVLEERARPDGSVERSGHAKMGPFAVVWDEHPFDFVENRWFRQTRIVRGGPFSLIAADITLEPEGGGTRFTWRVAIVPANLLGRLVLRGRFFARTGQQLDKTIRQAAAFAMGERADPGDAPKPELPPGAAERAAALVRRLEGEGQALAPRLAALVLEGAERDVERIRARQLARRWHVDPRVVIELCLAATKVGLLDMRWDVLCPRCRGAKVSAGGLDELPRGAHCPSCNVDYGREFARNVEVTFRPATTIRAVQPGGFCLASPALMPHVKVQQALAPGEDRVVEASLAPGPYRLRTLEAGGEVDIDHPGGDFPSIVVDGAKVSAGPPESPLRLRNAGQVRRVVVIESRAWASDALTAHEVTTMQAFRDRFGAETLRPGDEVEINQVTLMFTDLKGSTALYSRIGDARAYGIVREHFAFLTRTIRRQNGAIVKTIGDAVMAAFADPADAVRAALAVQEDIREFNARSAEGDIIIKLGLHAGPCIAVTSNDRLDYFGTTVNMAARLQGRSDGDDIVLSAGLADDPAVIPLLAGLPLGAESATLKGFDAEIPFLRIRPRPAASGPVPDG